MTGDTTMPGLDPTTVDLRDLMHASRELTGRMARALGTAATDVAAVGQLDMGGPMTVGALAERLAIRTASATVLVDRLVAAGRAERRPHPSDGRRTLVHLNPAARTESWAVWEPVIRAMDAEAARLAPDERAVVRAYLQRVTAAMLDT